ncbi:MAG TPA: GAF domain-containing sensor histidine kinase [Oscillatoriaceae cyanobacterium]
MSSSIYYFPATKQGASAPTQSAGLLQLALAINSGMTPEEVIDRLFERTDGVVPFDRISLALLQPNGELRIRHVRSKLPIAWGSGEHAGIRDSSLEPIIAENKIRIIRDLEAYYREHPKSYTAPTMLKEGIRSSLTLPLPSRRGVIGVLFFSSRQVDAYQREHAEVLQTIATAIGIAVERGELIEELRQANVALASLDRLKNTFLSNLSHELRTPLTVITSYTYALQDEVTGKLTPEQHDYLATIVQSADRLKALLSQLFDLTELESGVLKVEHFPLDLGQLVRDVGARQHVPPGLDFEVALPVEPLPISGDPQRLQQTLQALLDNALRFTPSPGQVTLRAGQNAHEVWAEVQDTGLGIAPENQEKVFEKFTQLDAGSTRERGGSGLSLALARAIARAHGGDIQLKSVLGRGSTFRLVLPRRPV